MKILTPQEEAEHNKVTWEGGLLGAAGGIAFGVLGIYVARRRFPAFRQLSLPLNAALVTASTSFSAVVTADRYSRNFEKRRNAFSDFRNKSELTTAQLEAQKPASQRVVDWLGENRYPIVVGSWAASMVIAFALVGRNPYLTGQQKLVQARVYAQGLTLAVLVASFALETNDAAQGKGRWETIKVLDENDPEHKRIVEKRIHHEAYQGEDQWMDMIEAQERKMKERGHITTEADQKKQKKSSTKEHAKAKDA